LQDGDDLGSNVSICDGGTIGLSLLSEIEDADRLIVVDAGELKAAPGELRVFEGPEMDEHLSRNGGTVHEVSMADLLRAARMTGREPRERALIVVQPELIDWADAPTPRVAGAIDGACVAARDLIARWRQ
jgi:hydrogenase maturation protease